MDERKKLFEAWVAAKEAHKKYTWEVFEPDRYNEFKGRELLRLYQEVQRTWIELCRFGLSRD